MKDLTSLKEYNFQGDKELQKTLGLDYFADASWNVGIGKTKGKQQFGKVA